MPLRRAPTSAKPFSLVTPIKVPEAATPGSGASAAPVAVDSANGSKPAPDSNPADSKAPDPQA